MPGRGIVRLAFSVALLLSVVALVFQMSDTAALRAALPGNVWPSVLLVALLLACGAMLSSLRLKLITADFGYRLTFRDAAMTLSVGQLAGAAFLQFAGQLIGRSAVLSARGIPAAATVVISGYERLAALSVSLLLAAGGGVYLFGTLGIDLEAGGLSLVKLALGLAGVVAAGAALAWGRPVLAAVRGLHRGLVPRLVRAFTISLAIQATTLAAYVALASALAPHIGFASLAAASCIVMLAASLPVSLGGWGLRELSAVVALQAIGLSSASALVVALLIGFLSLAVIAATALVVIAGAPRTATYGRLEPAPATPDYSALLDWMLPVAVATAVFFQIYLPTGGGNRISVNLADPLAILGGAVFVLHCVGAGVPQWRLPRLGAWVAAATSVVALAIVHGWIRFGWTDWAFVNRGAGWLTLLCYGGCGMLIVKRAQERGLECLLTTFAASGAAIASIELGLIALQRLGFDTGLVAERASGLSQNPNAFAFILVLAVAAVIVLPARTSARWWLMALLLAGIWFSGSRAAYLAVPIVLGIAGFMGLARRPMMAALLSALMLVAAISMLPIVSAVVSGAAALWGTSGSGAGLSPDAWSAIWPAVNLRDHSTTQHLQTVADGLAMYLAHPIFGAGLGAYMDEQVRMGAGPLVIHSTPVWLLAETGIVGAAVFAAAGLRLLAEAIRRPDDPGAALLLLMLCAIAVMSLAHDLLYQRAFWLLLGAVLVLPAANRISR